MAKFINPFTDVGFKRLFGQEISKPILLTFLNSLLTGERKIIDLQYLDKERIGLSDGDRSLIYDILCLTESGEYIIVEMQNKSQPFFKNRSIYYMSRSIVEQGERGSEWDYDIKAVYLVAFLNFKRLSEIAEVASLTKEERRQYDESLRHYRDTIAVMHGQYLEGEESTVYKPRNGHGRTRKYSSPVLFRHGFCG